jgi:hypothetical protein
LPPSFSSDSGACMVLPWPDPAEVKAVAFPLGGSCDPLPPSPPPLSQTSPAADLAAAAMNRSAEAAAGGLLFG